MVNISLIVVLKELEICEDFQTFVCSYSKGSYQVDKNLGISPLEALTCLGKSNFLTILYIL